MDCCDCQRGSECHNERLNEQQIDHRVYPRRFRS